MDYEAILLTDNLVFNDYGSTRYIGPYALSSQLNAIGIKSLVIDYFTRKENFFEYLDHFISADTLVVGISSTFLFPEPGKMAVTKNRSDGIDNYYAGELWFESGEELLVWTRDLKELIHKKAPKAKLILGGVKAQFAHWRPVFYHHFDNVFLGASDQSLIQFFQDIKKNSITERFIKQDASLKNQSICPVSVHTQTSAIQKNESLPIEISRGCLYDCKFCHYEKKSSQRKDLSKLRDEFIYNYEHFGTSVYHFCDDCFNDTRKKVEDTCNLFLSLPFKIEWVAYARADVAVKFNETVDLMLESGARGLYWGIESFDHEAARQAGKGTHPDLVKDFFLRYKSKFANRCITEGSFIVGLPGETEASHFTTLDWLIENDVFDFLTFGSLGLMPYSENFDQIIFDYADYSRNPMKYGFTKIEFEGRKYWEHPLMNSDQAKVLASTMTSTWREAKKSVSIFRSIWLYPHFRTLGFTHDEIFNFMTPANDTEKIKNQIRSRFNSHMSQYHADLLKIR